MMKELELLSAADVTQWMDYWATASSVLSKSL
ncbi:hypothetical protein AZE42_11289 [Rhizopogon vesiculosus]|uniref:Uncharacterized protein n=1 Tax=Rhizopogon vesiculosus TaxID=180088 RepID=A0A1J8Q3T1_9AGAM|nr:hypothetical protein AZE42_11289 [Rhizopogon vesiculosus]